MKDEDGAAGGTGANAPRPQGIASLEDELSIAADLAYLLLGEEERRAFAASVGRMLEFFAKMDEFPSPRGPDADASAAASNRLRADVRSPFAGPDPIELAPQREGRFVGIPNIL
ncbi:MAG: Asp-tRNA(Asn)/Glu-tRNA(Gln) amidotransferase subunit GatC [Rectinemataceae bacterium]